MPGGPNSDVFFQEVTNQIIQICNEMAASLRSRQECYDALTNSIPNSSITNQRFIQQQNSKETPFNQTCTTNSTQQDHRNLSPMPPQGILPLTNQENLTYTISPNQGNGLNQTYTVPYSQMNQTYGAGGSPINANQTYTIPGIPTTTCPNQTYTIGGSPTYLNQTYTIGGSPTYPNQTYTIGGSPINPNKTYTAFQTEHNQANSIPQYSPNRPNISSFLHTNCSPQGRNTTYDADVSSNTSGFRPPNTSTSCTLGSSLTPSSAPTNTDLRTSESETLYNTRRVLNISSLPLQTESSGGEPAIKGQSTSQSQDSRNGPSSTSQDSITGAYGSTGLASSFSLLSTSTPKGSGGWETSPTIPNSSQSSRNEPPSLSGFSTNTTPSNGSGSDFLNIAKCPFDVSTIQSPTGSSDGGTIPKVQNTSRDSRSPSAAQQAPVQMESTPLKRLIAPPPPPCASSGSSGPSGSGLPAISSDGQSNPTNPTTQNSTDFRSQSSSEGSHNVTVSSPESKKQVITPYCENLAYLKCPHCQKCIQLAIDTSDSDCTYDGMNMTTFIEKLKEVDHNFENSAVSAPGNNTSSKGNTTSASGAQQDDRPVAEQSFRVVTPKSNESPQPPQRFVLPLEVDGVTERSLREITPESNQSSQPPQRFALALEVDDRGDTIYGATSVDVSGKESLLSRRVQPQAAATELLRNPIADLPNLSSGVSPVRDSQSQGFDISQINPNLNFSSTAPLNTFYSLEEQWRQCDDSFKTDMIGLIPRLQNLIRMVQSLK